mgnify:CR=1 FL=1
MALAGFISGPYSSTYNSVATGPTKDGYRITHQMGNQAIDQSDTYGDSLLDFVTRGGSVRITYTCLAYAGGISPIYPFASSLWTLSAAATPIGRLASDIAQSLVLTSTASTPAAATPASLTATKAIVPPNFSVDLLYDSRLREVPVQLVFLPVASGGTVTWVTAT